MERKGRTAVAGTESARRTSCLDIQTYADERGISVDEIKYLESQLAKELVQRAEQRRHQGP